MGNTKAGGEEYEQANRRYIEPKAFPSWDRSGFAHSENAAN